MWDALWQSVARSLLLVPSGPCHSLHSSDAVMHPLMHCYYWYFNQTISCQINYSVREMEVLLWPSFIHALMPSFRQSWVSELYHPGLGIKMPALHMTFFLQGYHRETGDHVPLLSVLLFGTLRSLSLTQVTSEGMKQNFSSCLKWMFNTQFCIVIWNILHLKSGYLSI